MIVNGLNSFRAYVPIHFNTFQYYEAIVVE